MSETEGVIKYKLSFRETDLTNVDAGFVNCWRELLMRLELVGQHAGRYGGLGFGNLSMRTGQGFLITGTQTGAIPQLTLADYAEVTGWRLEENVIEAKGRIRPSSEALTHAAIYDACEYANFVFHCHSPDMWHAASKLGLIMTDPEIPYGTPSMAREVALKLAGMDCPGILAMGGHEDGIVAFGREADTTGMLVIQYLARAMR